MIGQMLRQYRVLDKLGAGGMGEVYRARDLRLERDVALKVLPAGALTDEAARSRLAREARMAARLNHPNVCTIYEVNEAEPSTGSGQDALFIAMELVEGQTLAACLAEGALPPPEVIRYGRQLAEALAHAHARGVVHRDFKTDNIVITPERRAKVLDFGIARPVTAATSTDTATASALSLTAPGVLAGTPAYMAPEQLKGAAADGRSDIWALGVVLYEMAAGRRPFRGQTLFALSAAILHEPPPPLPPGVPVPIAAIIERCLAKEPGERYRQAADVQAALEAAAAGTAVEAAAGPKRAPIVKLAVLPFANLSGDPQQEYLSDGLTQEMIAQLARLHPGSLGVIARTSVMRYKKSEAPIDQIARELGVDYVLEGSAQRDGTRILITAELIEVRGQSLLWADSFEREFSGILKLQRDVAQNVARALALTLLPSEQSRLASVRTVNPEAYDLYLKASQHWIKMTREDLDTAEGYLNLALQKDPNFARAWTGLGWVWACRNQHGYAPPGEAVPKFREYVLKAIALDDTLADAHYLLAALKTFAELDPQSAEQDWERAFELDPNYPDGIAGYSHYLAVMGRIDQAMTEIERAASLDPFDVTIRSFRAANLLFARRYDEALAEAQKLVAMDPGNAIALAMRHMSLVAAGAYEQALPGIKEYLKLVYGLSDMEAPIDRGLSENGFRGAMGRAAEALAVHGAAGKVLPIDVAFLYAFAGDNARVLDWLEKGYEVRDPNMPYIGLLPAFDPVRCEPRFQALLQRMNLPAD